MGKKKTKQAKVKKPHPFLSTLKWLIFTFLVICFWALVLTGGTGEDTPAMLVVTLVLTLIAVLHWKNTYTRAKSGKTGKNVPIDALSGLEFEHFSADVLRRNGFTNVRVTQASGDFGADIITTDEKGYLWVFQCKRYKSATLGNTPIQEIVAAKSHYGAQFAGVITNAHFSEAARLLARENGVTLIEREALFKMNSKEKEKQQAKRPAKKVSAPPASEEDWVEELIMYDEIFDE